MSDYLQAVSFLHAGKDWAFDSSNHLREIEMEVPESNYGGFTHLVFSIPRSKMRSNASTFADWQTSEEGSAESQKLKVVFSWFLDYVNRMSKSMAKKTTGGYDKKNTKPDGSLVHIFFEVVESEDGNTVGERIHVFNNRPETIKGNIVANMLKNAKTAKAKGKLKPWEQHKKYIVTPENIFLNIFNIYVGNTDATHKISECHNLTTNETNVDFKLYPENIFSFENFQIEGACEQQNNWKNYVAFNGGEIPDHYIASTYTPRKFKFPDERKVVKRFWMCLDPEYLWTKYLPSHQSKWVDLPEINLRLANPASPEYFNVYVKPCPGKCLIENFLGDKYTQIGNEYQTVFTDDVEEIKRIAKGRFVVHHLKQSPGRFNPDGGWIQGNIVYGNTLHLNHGDENMEYTERLKSKFQNQHSISSFDIIEMETSYRLQLTTNRREVQELMVVKFTEQCVSGDSDISAAGKCIARWLRHMRPELYERHGSFEFEIKDPSLSPFANMQFWFLQGLDSYMCVATAHPELVKLHYAAYDSYRQHGLNQLHWNVIYTGESATSKSYSFDVKKQLSIEGTITEITYQTTRADAIDGDQNDHITIFNEAPPGLFQAGPGDQNQDALSMMKEKLTSNRVRTKTFVKDEETGERKNRIAVSSQIGVYMGATNDNPALAEEAVKSRFHWGEFERIYRKDKSISDYQRKAFDMEQKPELMKKVDQFLFYTKDQQMKVFYIWKFIFCNIIHDICLDAASILLTQMSKVMKKDYNIRMPPRTVERYRILCRILTITNALDVVFNMKGGLHQGKPFELKQLLDVEPYLYCTEEIAYCALNMISVEISQLTISRDKTLDGLWRIFKANKQYKKDKEEDIDIVDYSYIRMTGGMKSLCTKIQNLIPFDSGKPSIHNIHSVLKTLGSEPFEGHNYSTTYGNRDYMDDLPQPVEGTKTQKPARISGNNTHDFHMELFKDLRLSSTDDKGIIEKCYGKIWNQQTRDRRIISGVPTRVKGVVQYPQLMHIVETEQTEKPPLVIRNSNRESTGVQTMLGISSEDTGSYDAIKLTMPIDEWAWQQRCINKLNMAPGDAINYNGVCIQADLEQAQHTMTYPKDLLERQNQSDRVVITSDQMTTSYDIQELLRTRKRRRVEQNIGNINL